MKYWLYLLLGCIWLMFGCAEGEVNGRLSDEVNPLVSCTVSEVRYPTSMGDFAYLYAGRGFLTDHNHLGYDIALAEGTAIHPIACGTLRIYRPATGYGTLVAVIEHHLASPITVTSGAGRSVQVTNFLSIYGHIRPSSLANGFGRVLSYTVGTTVHPNDVIGYIESDEENGDGAEHLHLGLRLQTAAEAQRIDPRAWFRGYDGSPSMAAYYTNPATMMPLLLGASSSGVDASTDVVPDAMPSQNQSCPQGMTFPPDDYCTNTYCPPRGLIADHLVCNSLGNWDCMCRMPSITGSGVRYEFQVDASRGYGANNPFQLRDQNWTPMTCLNTGITTMSTTADGWHRCDLASRLTPFVGSFFSSTHPDWGDRGNLGTIGNAPARCTPTDGVTWRITDLSNNAVLYMGPSSGLPCASVGSQDRHALP